MVSVLNIDRTLYKNKTNYDLPIFSPSFTNKNTVFPRIRGSEVKFGNTSGVKINNNKMINKIIC